MKINETVGIDVSKLTLDVCLHTAQLQGVFENSHEGLVQMYSWYEANCSLGLDQVLFVFEHTGIYSEELSDFLSDKGVPFTMVAGLEIKRSLGMARGKSDKKDAVAIARYAFRRREEIKPMQIEGKNIRFMKKLLSLRDRLVRQRAGFKASLKEQKRIAKYDHDLILLDVQKKAISNLDGLVSEIDGKLKDIIAKEKNLELLFSLITSINGVGKQTAMFLIAYTNGFTKFDNVRKCASYCGIAPFPNQSGTSLRGKTKVSHLANKRIKSLLDMCAKSAIISNYEMKSYYLKRTGEGKNKMCTINIIRNKLLSRIFAVVKRKTPYVDIAKFAA